MSGPTTTTTRQDTNCTKRPFAPCISFRLRDGVTSSVISQVRGFKRACTEPDLRWTLQKPQGIR
jgi:hypothetical protein